MLATAVTARRRARDARRRSRAGRRRRSFAIELFMLACLAYFLFPLFWLVVASTKSDTDLFSTFGCGSRTT